MARFAILPWTARAQAPPQSSGGSMQTSAQGIGFLERHEGVVLKAYRDPVGIWTIGAGLTAASGVVKPRAGMVLSREEASRLLGQALRRNYEPAVAGAMPGAQQHEFDGGVSFHFNTGAIARATWVPFWITQSWDQVLERLSLWNKGGGKVLPGLTRRRREEFHLIRYGAYSLPVDDAPTTTAARIVLPLTREELGEIHAAFRTLGYQPGNDPAALAKAEVQRFQQDHDLTVDGILGRATLSTLQRRLDAARKAKVEGATATVVGGGSAAGSAAPGLEALPWAEALPWVAGGLILLWALWRAWTYRDAIAAKVQGVAPGLARFLRRV